MTEPFSVFTSRPSDRTTGDPAPAEAIGKSFIGSDRSLAIGMEAKKPSPGAFGEGSGTACGRETGPLPPAAQRVPEVEEVAAAPALVERPELRPAPPWPHYPTAPPTPTP